MTNQSSAENNGLRAVTSFYMKNGASKDLSITLRWTDLHN